jgi:hypothetical protein
VIEIRKSSIPNAGLGVWSTDFIPKDTLITEYYGEHLMLDDFILFKAKSSKRFSDEQLSRLHSRLPYIRKYEGVHVFGDPESRDISRCGQLINDYLTILDFQNDSDKISIQEHQAYENESIAKSSVYTSLIEGKLLCYAKNNIVAGQELFQSYGAMYWYGFYGLTLPKELHVDHFCERLIHSARLKKILTKSNI